MGKALFFLVFSCTLFWACGTQKASNIVGGEYNPAKNQTDYFVVPYGSVALPGKWQKERYNAVSGQQYFVNADSILISVAFNRFDQYQFNSKGKHKGFEFAKAYYEWDTDYHVRRNGLMRTIVETDSINHFYLYRLQGAKVDNYFLVGEKNGNASIFTVNMAEKWSPNEKCTFLKQLFLAPK